MPRDIFIFWQARKKLFEPPFSSLNIEKWVKFIIYKKTKSFSKNRRSRIRADFQTLLVLGNVFSYNIYMKPKSQIPYPSWFNR